MWCLARSSDSVEYLFNQLSTMRAAFVRAVGFRSSEVSDSQLLRDLGTGRDDSIRRLGSNVVEAGSTALQHGPDAAAFVLGPTPWGRTASALALGMDVVQALKGDLSGVWGAGLGASVGAMDFANSRGANFRAGVAIGYVAEQALQATQSSGKCSSVVQLTCK